MFILSSFQGGIVVHLYDEELSVALFYVHPIQSFTDSPCRMLSQIYYLWRHLIRGHALHVAIDDMAVDRGLDLEGLRGYDIPAGVKQLAIDHPHPPVEPALDVLLNHNPVG